MIILIFVMSCVLVLRAILFSVATIMSHSFLAIKRMWGLNVNKVDFVCYIDGLLCRYKHVCKFCPWWLAVGKCNRHYIWLIIAKFKAIFEEIMQLAAIYLPAILLLIVNYHSINRHSYVGMAWMSESHDTFSRPPNSQTKKLLVEMQALWGEP